MLDQLQRRGFSLTNRCATCKEQAESANHLFIRCPIAWELWALMWMIWLERNRRSFDGIEFSVGLLKERFVGFLFLGKQHII